MLHSSTLADTLALTHFMGQDAEALFPHSAAALPKLGRVHLTQPFASLWTAQVV